MISTFDSREAATAPAWTDCQNRCARPLGMTAIRFLSCLPQPEASSSALSRQMARAFKLPSIYPLAILPVGQPRLAAPLFCERLSSRFVYKLMKEGHHDS